MPRCRIKTGRLSISGFSSIIAVIIAASAIAENVDPKSILQGVLNSRMGIPPSRANIRITNLSPLGERTIDAVVYFKGAMRRFDQQGNPRIRSAFDGQKIAHYDGKADVNIRALSNPMGEPFFDLRCLGINNTMAPWFSPEECLHLHDATQIQLVDPKASIFQYDAWLIRVVDGAGYQHDFFVGKTGKFPVYRYVFHLKESEPRVITSKYLNVEAPLPNSVEILDSDDGKVRIRTVIEILDLVEDNTMPDTTWTLAGLDVPIGTPVTDIEAKRRVGYWDGQGLSELPPTPEQIKARGQQEVRTTRYRWLIGLNALALGVLLLWIAARRLRSRKEAA